MGLSIKLHVPNHVAAGSVAASLVGAAAGYVAWNAIPAFVAQALSWREYCNKYSPSDPNCYGPMYGGFVFAGIVGVGSAVVVVKTYQVVSDFFRSKAAS